MEIEPQLLSPTPAPSVEESDLAEQPLSSSQEYTAQSADVDATLSVVPCSINVKIKKIERSIDEDDYDDGMGSADATIIHSPVNQEREMEEYKTKARKDLEDYLTVKGLDPRCADSFNIFVRRVKIGRDRPDRPRKSEPSGFAVSYTSDDGIIHPTKMDVVRTVQDNQSKAAVRKDVLGDSERKIESYTQSKSRIAYYLSYLPMDVEGIKVISFGVIDKRSAFSSLVQLYPIGYKCEQLVNMSPIRGVNRQTLITCEILEEPELGCPEFCITVNSTGQTYLSFSETGVWKKFDPTNIDVNWCPSFFNLEVELLIEGLDGALDCDGYKFHVERGYGDSYTRPDQVDASKIAYLAKVERERRNHERQRQRFMTSDEIKQSLEAEKKKQEADAEMNKRMVLLEKERQNSEKGKREKEKEESRRQKDSIREAAKAEKERERFERNCERLERDRERVERERERFGRVAMGERVERDQPFLDFGKMSKDELKAERDRQKAIESQLKEEIRERRVQEDREHRERKMKASQERKERSKADDKQRVAARKEVRYEIKKLQGEAASSVLKYFDEEENAVSLPDTGLKEVTSVDVSHAVTSLEELLEGILDADREPFNDSSSQGEQHATKVLLNVVSTSDAGESKCESFAYDVHVSSSMINFHRSSAISWDNILEVVNFLHLFRKTLILKDAVKLEVFLNHLKTSSSITPVTSSTTNGISPPSRVVEATLESEVTTMEVVKEKTSELMTRMDSSEEEWDDNFDCKPSTEEEIAGDAVLTVENRQDAQKASEAFFDRINLHICMFLRKNLHDSLDFNDKESESGRKDKRQGKVTLPLNPLTWQELARMSLINFLCEEIGKSKDDIVHALRGGRLPNHRMSGKNIVRYIRYRMITRARSLTKPAGTSTSTSTTTIQSLWKQYVTRIPEGTATMENHPRVDEQMASLFEDRLLTRLNLTVVKSLLETPRGVSVTLDPLPLRNDFFTEDEIIQSLTKAASDVNGFPEWYRRCCLVVVKVISCREAKNLIWEVDREAYPDYYYTISNPITFVNIVSNLLEKSYGGDELPEEVGTFLFYRDMRQVLLNCSTFNTEITYLYTQAQKLFHVLIRHMHEWVWSARRPPIEKCDESYCLLSSSLITPELESIKCGRCTGRFLIHELNQLDQLSDPYLIFPSAELLEQNTEEWYCSMCLQEDSLTTSTTAESSNISMASSSDSGFYIDEFGASVNIPWLFDQAHSEIIEDIKTNYAHLIPVLDALRVVASDRKSSLIDTRGDTPAEEDGSDQQQQQGGSWSAAERVTVMLGLCKVLEADSRNCEFFQSLQTDCEKLAKLIDKPNIVAGNDCQVVITDIIGADALPSFRQFIRQVDLEKEFDFDASKVIEGRCVVCKSSTYEEDVGPDAQIVLCDRCGAECHLTCLDIPEVPKKQWNCPACVLLVDAQTTADATKLFNIDEYRTRDAEEQLVQQSMEAKLLLAAGGDAEAVTQNSICCAYCGMMDFELCSPLVYGQTRDEHNFCVSSSVPSASHQQPSVHSAAGKAVKFTEGSKAPTPSVPFFPLVNSAQGGVLRKTYDEAGLLPVVVHEICALQMFDARMDRKKHILRRRRKLVGDKALLMSGLKPLDIGTDSAGREYWKFATSDDLFICFGAAPEEERQEFHKLIGKEHLLVSATGAGRQWRRVSDTEIIQKITNLLGDSTSDRRVKKNIADYFLAERLPKMKDVGLSAPADNSKTSNNQSSSSRSSSSNMEALASSSSSSADTNLNVPVALKLMTEKSVNILPKYFVSQESVFSELDVDEGDEDGHFSFSKSKFYGVALVNQAGKRLKMSRNAVTVIYQIHCEGITSPLVYTPLSEAWSDNVYYFSTVSFKKSGRYSISFQVVSGGNGSHAVNVAHLAPLVFPVSVEAQVVYSGPQFALMQLMASKFHRSTNRLVMADRREFEILQRDGDNFENVASELQAVKLALLTVYYALPLGSLVLQTNEDYTTNLYGSTSIDYVLDKSTLPLVSEPSGWNDILHKLWKNAVHAARSPVELMECVLLLENYLNKAWLSQTNQRLLNGLAFPHFAIRCATLSAAALRLYCIDSTLIYDKVTIPASQSSRRSLTSSTRGGLRTTSDPGADDSQKEGHRDQVDDIGGGLPTKSRRAAASNANSKIQRQSAQQNYDEEEEEEEVLDHNLKAREMPRTTHNDAKKRKRVKPVQYREEYDDEEEEEDGVDEEEDNEDRRPVAKKASSTTSNRDRRSQGSARSSSFMHPNDEEEEAEIAFSDSELPEKRLFTECIKKLRSIQNEDAAVVDLAVRFVNVLQRLAENKNTVWFWNPVDCVAYSDYRSYVSEPMDLGTILHRVIGMQRYRTSKRLFYEDVSLVWQNCMIYNPSDSYIYTVAKDQAAIFERLYKFHLTSS